MRRFPLLVAAALSLMLPTASIAAPIGATRPATGRALILIPLTLTKIDDLDFGTVVPSGLSGAISIDATTGNRTIVGGLSGVPSDPGRRAYFATAGSPNHQVMVTISQPLPLTSVAGDTVPVLALTLDGASIRTIDPTTRNFFFGVGGIIMVGANQPEGVYSATFNVTATYL